MCPLLVIRCYPSVLADVVQNGIAVIPKTIHVERMKENIDILDFTLSDSDMKQIAALDTGHNVTGWPDDELCYKPGQ